MVELVLCAECKIIKYCLPDGKGNSQCFSCFLKEFNKFLTEIENENRTREKTND